MQPGNAVAMLANGDAAYPPMLAAIDGAAASIGLSSYIFRADRLGNEFIAALSSARRRGVEVRVLIDGYGGGYLRSASYRELRHAGVRPRASCILRCHGACRFSICARHRKILSVDGRIAFTGGLNIGAENVIARNPRSSRCSTAHFRFEGPVVAQLCEAFAAQWFFTTGEVLTGPAWFPRARVRRRQPGSRGDLRSGSGS